ncbi:hypothetical protein NT6N_09670 [Oceaniferula spumae]|uniref:Uncharacterized protein n=1 Tax=Oceaniferula spumae TaxID=2979115 RepID=A0AAT9FJ10_9BACT
MSWISENYDKVALGGAAVVALAFGAVIFSNKGAIDEAVGVNPVTPNNDVTVPGFAAIEATQTSLSEEHIITQYDLDGRKVNLLTGVALFAKKDDAKNPVDLLKSPPVHDGIPNTWWLEYGIDPGFSDSPEQDPDKDGFTNREEYTAGTNPKDFKIHPDPVTKLTVKDVKTTQVHVRPQDFGGGQFNFRLQTKAGVRVNKMGPNPIKAGEDIVFEDDLMKNRFKFLGVEEEEVRKNGIAQVERYWLLEDKQPNKLGKKYKVDRQGNPGILDSTVEFTLNALGQGASPFKVKENTRFSLPFNENATEKPYLLKKVDLDAQNVEIEYTDKEGNTKSLLLNIPK